MLYLVELVRPIGGWGDFHGTLCAECIAADVRENNAEVASLDEGHGICEWCELTEEESDLD